MSGTIHPQIFPPVSLKRRKRSITRMEMSRLSSREVFAFEATVRQVISQAQEMRIREIVESDSGQFGGDVCSHRERDAGPALPDPLARGGGEWMIREVLPESE